MRRLRRWMTTEPYFGIRRVKEVDSMKVQIPGTPNILGNDGVEILQALLEAGFMEPEAKDLDEYVAFLEKAVAERFDVQLDGDGDLEGRAEEVLYALAEAGELDVLED